MVIRVYTDELTLILYKQIELKLDLLKFKYRKWLQEEVMNTVYSNPYASGLYERTFALYDSISVSEVKRVGNTIEFELFFDQNISNRDHYSVVSGSNIYENREIYVAPLLGEGHVQKLWSQEDYPAMQFVERTIERIKKDIYKELNNIISIAIEKVGGKKYY